MPPDEVPPDAAQETYERLGIPEAERHYIGDVCSSDDVNVVIQRFTESVKEFSIITESDLTDRLHAISVRPNREGAAAIFIVTGDNLLVVSIGRFGRFELGGDQESIEFLHFLLEATAHGEVSESRTWGVLTFQAALANGKVVKSRVWSLASNKRPFEDFISRFRSRHYSSYFDE